MRWPFKPNHTTALTLLTLLGLSGCGGGTSTAAATSPASSTTTPSGSVATPSTQPSVAPAAAPGSTDVPTTSEPALYDYFVEGSGSSAAVMRYDLGGKALSVAQKGVSLLINGYTYDSASGETWMPYVWGIHNTQLVAFSRTDGTAYTSPASLPVGSVPCDYNLVPGASAATTWAIVNTATQTCGSTSSRQAFALPLGGSRTTPKPVDQALTGAAVYSDTTGKVDFLISVDNTHSSIRIYSPGLELINSFPFSSSGDYHVASPMISSTPSQTTVALSLDNKLYSLTAKDLMTPGFSLPAAAATSSATINLGGIYSAGNDVPFTANGKLFFLDASAGSIHTALDLASLGLTDPQVTDLCAQGINGLMIVRYTDSTSASKYAVYRVAMASGSEDTLDTGLTSASCIRSSGLVVLNKRMGLTPSTVIFDSSLIQQASYVGATAASELVTGPASASSATDFVIEHGVSVTSDGNLLNPTITLIDGRNGTQIGSTVQLTGAFGKVSSTYRLSTYVPLALGSTVFPGTTDYEDFRGQAGSIAHIDLINGTAPY